MKKKIALITGITGQTGSYLAEFLLKKKYEVHGIIRRSSLINTHRIDHIYDNKKLKLHYGDLSDALNLAKIIDEVKPTEIYNLAAQSHVAVSFELAEYTTDINALGCLRILEIIKQSKKKIKFYQASTSELYGLTLQTPQTEKTYFQPQSPYAISKLYAYWMTKHYRNAHGLFSVNGILFNHESPRRGETFITRKITIGLSKIVLGQKEVLEVGNLKALRDWGHARDYAEMQWLMLQNKVPTDYVISTGKQYSIKNFIQMCLKDMGIQVLWKGKGLEEVAIIKSFPTNKNYKIKKGQIIIKVNKKYFRPLEVNSLLGDSSKARKELKWKNKYTINQLVSEMLSHDYQRLKNKVENDY
ncbi:GDP-mannose 4,6-dehydratase [Candidatus Pelagibacter sp.]|jgi:GDPmannose 4,6-dehydratase|nr:GDP-mannose 4,6-dehydratase [Candidatus Pelagibacter sp.]